MGIMSGTFAEYTVLCFSWCWYNYFGHTHKQCNKIINGQLCFNPGSPTDRRMEKNYSFGIIELADEIKAEIIEF